MSYAAKPKPGALLRRGVGIALLVLVVGCASEHAASVFPLANGGRPVKNPQGICVQIGLIENPAQAPCYQLAQPDLQQHVEPLPLDEFGYLFPLLKPQPVQAPSPVPAVAAQAPPAPTATPAAVQYREQSVHFLTPLPFRLNSAHLSRGNRAALTAFVNSLEHYHGVVSIRVTGHTDRSGPEHFNQWLSLIRAKSVQLRLLSLGADPRSIQIRGAGSREPRPQTHAAAANRYVDLEVRVRVPVK